MTMARLKERDVVHIHTPNHPDQWATVIVPNNWRDNVELMTLTGVHVETSLEYIDDSDRLW